MRGPHARFLALAGMLATAGACSLAGLDDYAKGTGGGKVTSTTGSGANGGSTGSTASGGTGTTTTSDAGPDASPCDDVDLMSDALNCGACGHACPDEYACISGVCGNAVVDVSTFLHTCAVLRGGEVWCWGRDVWGEVGITPSMVDSTCPFNNNKCQSVPAKIDGISDAVEVSAGAEATCARTKGGDVYCWGSNAKGLLGHPTDTDPLCQKAGGPNNGQNGHCLPVPTKVSLPPGVQAAQIAMGSAVACIRTTTKDVYCWGSNKNGELRAPPGGIYETPIKNANVNGDAEDLAVSVDDKGDYGTVCVRQSGTDNVRCWGQSVGRTLFYTANVQGCSQAYCNPSAKTVEAVIGLGSSPPVLADAIQVGWRVGCALRQGALTCWGDNNYGQSGLPQGMGSGHFDAKLVPGIMGEVAQVSNRCLTTLFLDTQGSVFGLGWTGEGQINNGSLQDADNCPGGNGQRCLNQVTPIAGLTGIAKVVSGPNSSAAITTDGKLFMWGSNYTASLGHAPGTGMDTTCPESQNLLCNPVPQVVSGLP
jgi:hypothetical protein